VVRAKNYESASKFVKVMQRKLWPLFFPGHGVHALYMCICSEGGLSPVAHTDNNGGSTINEILHETAKYAFHSTSTVV